MNKLEAKGIKEMAERLDDARCLFLVAEDRFIEYEKMVHSGESGVLPDVSMKLQMAFAKLDQCESWLIALKEAEL